MRGPRATCGPTGQNVARLQEEMLTLRAASVTLNAASDCYYVNVMYVK